jgi:hypothetical protein
VSEHVAWAKGGTASFVSVADDVVTLRSSIPSPPGSRLEGVLVAEGTADADAAPGTSAVSGAESPTARVSVKVHGSKLELDGTFTLKGRLLEATRALRARVAALVAPR